MAERKLVLSIGGQKPAKQFCQIVDVFLKHSAEKKESVM